MNPYDFFLNNKNFSCDSKFLPEHEEWCTIIVRSAIGENAEIFWGWGKNKEDATIDAYLQVQQKYPELTQKKCGPNESDFASKVRRPPHGWLLPRR